jgi:hypothetical protein
MLRRSNDRFQKKQNREELTVGNAISSLNTFVIRGIKLQVVFLWIIRVLASLKVSQLGEIQLYMDLVEYSSRSSPQYLTELDVTLSMSENLHFYGQHGQALATSSSF